MRRPGFTIPRILLAAALASLVGGTAMAARPRPHTDEPPAAAAAPRPEKVEKGADANAKYRARAEDLRNQNKLDEALAQYQNALVALPDDVQTLQDYGKTLYARGRFPDAVEKFRRLSQVAADQPVAYYNLGYALRRTQDYAGAADAYGKYVQLMPDDPDGLYSLAECLRAQKKFADAAAQYDAYIAKETRPAEQQWVEKARAKSQSLHAGGEGLVATSRSGGSSEPAPRPEPAPAQPTMAERLAVATPAPAVAAPPVAPVVTAPVVVDHTPAPAAPPPAAVVALAPANGGGGLLGTAPAPRPMAGNRDPTAAAYKIREGDGMFGQKHFREALFAYQDAVKLDDQSVNALLKMGLAYANLNYFKEAIDKWNRVLELDPANQYAKVYIERARPRLAQPAAAPADQPQPVRGDTVTTVAAPAAPAPTSTVNPQDDADARDAYRRAVALMGQTRFADAVVELTTSTTRNPNFTNAYVARAGAYLGLRNYNEAVTDYTRSLQLDPSLATPLYGLARAYEKLGDKAKACDYYRRYGTSNGRDAQQKLKEQALAASTAVCQ